jgi:lipoate-protein ligase A
VLVDGPGDPAWNMAVDGALLALAEAPTLRFYGWRPHAVSLGYFQRLADFADLPAATPMVRRTTGGGAIHHGDELTFSLALDAALLPGAIAASYVLLHDALVRALDRLGVRCRRSTEGAMSARPEDRWCFAHPVQGDLLVDGRKLCGSAQRRVPGRRPRVLHHGSLVIRRPEHTPFVAAIEDQIEPTDDVRRGLHELVRDEVANLFDLESTASELTAQERAMAARLRDERFGNAAHLQKR